MASPEPVRSGSFLVDRRRALAMLGRFQLRSPYLFPLAWARAAAAAGADLIEARDLADRFELRFGGRPFAAEELKQLFDHLPAEQAGARLRELARGALTALALKPAALTVSSGAAGGRFVLALNEQGDSVQPIEEEETRTTAALFWPGGRRPQAFAEAVDALRTAAYPGLLRFSTEERPSERLPEGAYWERFETPSLRGWLAEGRHGRGCELRVYYQRILAGTLEVDPGAAEPVVRALLNDDGLSLTLSQESVVQDESFERMAKGLRAAARDFAVRRARDVARRLPMIGGWLRDPLLYTQWRAAFQGEPEARTIESELQRRLALDAGSARGREADVERWGPVVAWLRETAKRVFRDGRKPADNLERALWNTPLYLTVDGLPVTLEEAARFADRRGVLPVRERKHAGDSWGRAEQEIPIKDRAELLELLAGPFGDRLGEL